MRYSRPIALLPICAVFATLASSAAESPARAGEEAALLALEQTWVTALQKGDMKTLSAVLANTYVDTDETGHRGDKATVMSAVNSGALKFSSIRLLDMKAAIYGDAGIVTGAGEQHGAYEGQPIAERVVFTDTFIRAGRTWIVVASQRTVAPK